MANSFYNGYITGNVDASVVFSAIDNSLLQPLLPQGVELAPQAYAPAGKHPVYWTFNFHQQNVTTPVPGLRLNYNEFAFVIPCVRLSGGKALYAYPVVLYLNSWLGVLGGRILWGLNKKHNACSISEGGESESFQAEGRLTGIFQRDGGPQPASWFSDFLKVKPMLNQPLLTVGADGPQKAAFILDFDNAAIQPLKGEIATQQFLPGLSGTVFPFQSLGETTLGGFSFSVPWKLQRPERVEVPSQPAKARPTPPPAEAPDPGPLDPVAPNGPKQKVVVLGAGLGGLSAAFELTDYEGWENYYDVTVYQFGWQLGGKCRTGRGPNDRIEEHGIHVFLGFYNNAMRMVRLAFEELKQKRILVTDKTWESLFIRENAILLPKYSIKEESWLQRVLVFPENDQLPGIGEPPSEQENIKKMLLLGLEMVVGSPFLKRGGGCLGWLGRTVLRWFWSKPQTPANYKPTFVRKPEDRPAWWADLEKEALQQHGHKEHPLLHHAKALIEAMPSSREEAQRIHAALNGAPHSHEKLAHLLFEAFAAVEKIIAPFVGSDSRIEVFWRFMQLGYYNYVGLNKIYNPQTGTYDFESINHLDYREWLRENGAPEEVAWSAPVKDIYTLVFAYPHGGDSSQPGSIGAGTALMGAMLIMLGYKGSIMYRFAGGTGDVIISHVYEALKARGVKFKFFHEVEQIAYAQGDEIEEIVVGEQIRLKDPDREFEPTKDIKGLKAWASHPFWRWKELADQIDPTDLAALQQGNINLNSSWSGWKNRRSFTLKKGTDFDQVVLAISVAGLKTVCKDIIDHRPDWKDMTDKVETVQTFGVQLWVKDSLKELGLDLQALGLENGEQPILDTYANPLNSYADFTDLLQFENWNGAEIPQSVAYFTGPLSENGPIAPFSDTTFPERQNQRVLEATTQWLTDNAGFLWPNARTRENPTGFDLNKLVDPDAKPGEPELSGLQKLNKQFFLANVDPSERYVLSVPKSSKYRFKADQSGYKNLFLAGDWIDTGYNMGCAEVAVMSGRMAGQAVRKNAYGLKRLKPILKDMCQDQ